MNHGTDFGAEPTLAADAAGPFSMDARPVVGERYELLGMLGRGGMGAVYRVRDRELDEVVAVKVLRSDFAADPRVLEILVEFLAPGPDEGTPGLFGPKVAVAPGEGLLHQAVGLAGRDPAWRPPRRPPLRPPPRCVR